MQCQGNCKPSVIFMMLRLRKAWFCLFEQTMNAVPVLCVARNVACNVRGYFFKCVDLDLCCFVFQRALIFNLMLETYNRNLYICQGI